MAGTRETVGGKVSTIHVFERVNNQYVLAQVAFCHRYRYHGEPSGHLPLSFLPLAEILEKMKPLFLRRLRCLCLVIPFAISSGWLIAETPIAELRGDDAAQGFQSIFNGIDFAGWQGDIDNYEVRDGAIVCKQDKGGVLFTKEEYGDFIVRVEFLLPPAGNNGLAIRFPGKGRASYDGMCELQIIDETSERFSKLDPRQYHGAAYGIAPAQPGHLRPVGEWNYQQVTVQGSKIRVELNGTVIMDTDLSTIHSYKDDRPHPGKDLKRGHFGLAGHKDPVRFRNLAIKPLRQSN